MITDHGREVLELKPHTPVEANPLQQLRGSVVELKDPFSPVDEDEWEAAN